MNKKGQRFNNGAPDIVVSFAALTAAAGRLEAVLRVQMQTFVVGVTGAPLRHFAPHQKVNAVAPDEVLSERVGACGRRRQMRGGVDIFTVVADIELR